MRKIALVGGLLALAAVARRALRKPAQWDAPPPLASPDPWLRPEGGAVPEPAASAAFPATPLEPARATDVPPAPPAPKPAADADQSDREVESRLDDETKYDRFREQEEAARHAAAERLRNDPLVEPDADAAT